LIRTTGHERGPPITLNFNPIRSVIADIVGQVRSVILYLKPKGVPNESKHINGANSSAERGRIRPSLNRHLGRSVKVRANFNLLKLTRRTFSETHGGKNAITGIPARQTDMECAHIRVWG
jgi:hypothetical protein